MTKSVLGVFINNGKRTLFIFNLRQRIIEIVYSKKLLIVEESFYWTPDLAHFVLYLIILLLCFLSDAVSGSTDPASHGLSLGFH